MGRVILLAALLSVVLFFALASGFPPFYRLVYVLSGAIAVGFLWAWANLRGLSLTVVRPSREAHAYDWVEEHIEVKNRVGLPRWSLEVSDQATLPALRTGRVIHLSPGGSHSWSVRVRCNRRGVFTLGPARVSSRDPFGVFRLSRTFGAVQSLLVYPAVVPLPQFAAPIADQAGESRRHRRVHQATASASSIRDYQPGDPFNRIHWPSTARFQKPMLKEFDLEPTSDFWVVLDLEGAVQAGEGEESTEEYGVTIAASVAKRFLDAQLKVGLIAYGEQPVTCLADVGEAQFARIMQALALVRAKGTVPLAEALAFQEHQLGMNSTLVTITPSASPDIVSALRRLALRGVKSQGVLLDQASFGGAYPAQSLANALAVHGMPVYVVRRGDDIARALSSTAMWQAREALAR